MTTGCKAIVDFVETMSQRTQEWESTLVQLTPRYQLRWDHAVHMYTTHILPAMLDDNTIVIFNGVILDKDARLSINMHRKEIKLIDGNVSYVLYMGDPAYDEGAHDTVSAMNAKIRGMFIMCKNI